MHHAVNGAGCWAGTAVRGGVLLLLILTRASQAAPLDSQPPKEDPFQAWLKGATKAEGLVVCQWGLLEGDRLGPGARFAWLADKDFQSWLLMEDGGKRWVLDPALGGDFEIPCDGGKTPPWQRGLHHLSLALSALGTHSVYQVAMRQGQPAIIHSEDQSRFTRTICDWDLLFCEQTETNVLEEVTQTAWSYVAIRPPKARSPLPPSRNWILSGKPGWTGRADAAVDVEATRLASGEARFSIRVSDDVAIALYNSEDVHAWPWADHVQVWFCGKGQERSCTKAALRGMGIARQEDGALAVRWLYPENNHEALPAVDAQDGMFHVTLETSDFNGGFTVVFSDVDKAGVKQETVVATSLFRLGEPTTLGQTLVESERYRMPEGLQRLPPNERITGDTQ